MRNSAGYDGNAVNRQISFRSSRSLPLLLSADGWNWWSLAGKESFWVGEDTTGTRWLVKCRGGFRAVRERAFSLIAQGLGISCQSSTFLKLSPEAPPLLSGEVTDVHQLAILFLDEHGSERSCGNCPLTELNYLWRAKPYDVDVLAKSHITNAIDVARGAMLGMLCEMSEPPGWLFTKDHVFVQIDNELMFCRNAGATLWESPWVTQNGVIKPSGLAEAIRLCECIVSLPDQTFHEALELPDHYRPKMSWSLREEIDAIRPRAQKFIQDTCN